MAVNCPRRPTFPAHLPEDNLVQLVGSQEEDIVDILPADPFGMDIKSTVTAITGWLEDFGADYGRYRGAEVGVDVGKGGHYPIFAGLNLLWDTAMEFQPFVGHTEVENMMCGGANTFYGFDEELGQSVCDGDVHYGSCAMEGVIFGGCGTTASVCGNEYEQRGDEMVDDTEDGDPHPALSFALAYLSVPDLLRVEKVCKSLQFTVQSDPLLWKNIRIEKPHNNQVTDDVLLRLTNRAQGNLQCLTLVQCQKVTDDGLKRVLENNPRLIKLSVPGCTRLSIDGVVRCLRDFQVGAITGLKYLRVGGLFGVTTKHFEELTSLLGIHNHVQANHHKPRFYRQGNIYLSCDDDRPIDIEMCPQCQTLKLVYDCPDDSCQSNDHAAQRCRACIHCIDRCGLCGRCFTYCEYTEEFHLDNACSVCKPRVSRCQGGQDIVSSPSEHAVSQEPAPGFHG